MNFVELMTNKMRECLISEDEIEKEIRLCYKNFRESYEQYNVKLPLQNEEGLSVVHGCRVLIVYVCEYWSTRLTAATRYGRSSLTKNKQIQLEQEMPGLSFVCYPVKYVD